MLNILTAIDDFEVAKVLGDEDYINVISKDISYREGILEQIEINKKIDLIIIDEKIDGEIKIKDLIKKIKEKIKNIKIIIITNNENKIKEEIKRFKRIKIYETNKIKIKKLLKIIDYEKDDKVENNILIKKGGMEEENSKKILEEDNDDEKNTKEKIEQNSEEFDVELIKKYMAEKVFEKDLNKKNIISISGANGCGKTMTSLILSRLNNKTKNLLIDFNSDEKQDIATIVNRKNSQEVQKINRKMNLFSTSRATKVKEILRKDIFEDVIIDLGLKQNNEKLVLELCRKNIVLIEPNLLGIKKCKNLLDYYFNELKIDRDKILILINKKEKYSIDKEIIKNLFKNIKIVGEIKSNFKYEKIMNNGFNKIDFILNNKERKEIKKILNKIFL